MTVNHAELKVEHEPIDNVSPHPDNANSGDVQALDESIDITGFYSPIIVQASTGYILAGNHRWEVMKARGEETIPVVYVDVTDAEARRIMVADNRITRLGEDDPALLAPASGTDRGNGRGPGRYRLRCPLHAGPDWRGWTRSWSSTRNPAMAASPPRGMRSITRSR
jgi:hypothetical protein